ncbi:amino acid permease C-terminal domain-containing protein [Streptomyces sp. CNQ085]|uniref:amino acid permease C-terminal domain-containing protein n=1 Tax=Streptomyces sp. CNQ085 TaxID=2886944 RepID=UPI0035AE38D7
MRRTHPRAPRGFRVPLSPLLPAPGFGFCVWTMAGLDAVTWTVFGLWLAGGLALHLSYGIRHSRLNEPGGSAATDRTGR